MSYLNPDKFDFWRIYNSVNEFFPLGPVNERDNIIAHRKLESLIIDNIHQKSLLNRQWEHLNTEVENELGKAIIGTTYGRAAAFSSSLQLEKARLDNLTRTKDLHFFLSLIGPFYTIIGEDINSVKIGERRYRSTSYLAVSPENEFGEPFETMCRKIEDHFSGFRFVPFAICRETIETSAVTYGGDPLNVIFHALFNDYIDLGNQTIGNESFKLHDWLTEGSVPDEGNWTTHPD